MEILEALVANGHDVTALTNFNQDLFRITREAYPFLDLFRGVTVSGEQRMVKPDPAIYAHHAEAFGLAPAATLFFDDVPEEHRRGARGRMERRAFHRSGADADRPRPLWGRDLDR